jgi:hypothetical protein
VSISVGTVLDDTLEDTLLDELTLELTELEDNELTLDMLSLLVETTQPAMTVAAVNKRVVAKSFFITAKRGSFD